MITTNLRRGAISTSVAVAAVAIMGVGPAHAAETRSGNKQCTSTFQVRLRVDSGAAGSGSWVNNNTSAAQGFSFPAGASYKFSPYQNTFWSVTSPTFFYAASATCVQ